ncbi:hypothetical protein HMPREF1572_00631 [Gardnerella vaginalis JCP7275]|nr:hypothetical protein HMPREF1572_00631 [Gardnerella vaginalis JCP7275]
MTFGLAFKRFRHFVPGHASVETKYSMHFVSNAAACLLVQSALIFCALHRLNALRKVS